MQMPKRVTILVVMLLIVSLAFAAGCGAKQEVHAAGLAGTEWLLTSLMGEDPIAGSEITLSFEKGHVTGHMGCNGYGGGPDSGKYEARANGRLSIGPLAVTLQLCSEPEGIMEQEAAYIGALHGAASYRMTDSRLEMVGADGETVLIFARQQ